MLSTIASSCCHGRLLVSDNKVVNVERNTVGELIRSHVSIDSAERLLIIDFQNENLVARFHNGQIIASLPDLITLVQQDSAQPLVTEIVKYGYHVSIFILPAPELLTTPSALQYIGLKVFDNNFPHYKSIPSHTPIKSVWDVFYKKESPIQQ